jgi:hypothetical protein
MSPSSSPLGAAIDLELRRLRRGLLWAAFRDYATQLLTLALFLGGGFILAQRRLFPEHEAVLAPVLVALGLGSLLGALALCWSRRLSHPDLLAWADREAAAGGLLLTLDECPDPHWQPLAEARLREVETPRLRLHERTRLFLPALLFFGLSALVPPAEIASPPFRDAGERFTASIEERIARMEKEELLEKKEGEALRRDLEALRRDLEREGLGARQWEALDSMRRGLSERLNAHARDMARAAQAGQEAGTAHARSEAAVATEFADALRGLDPERLQSRLGEGLDQDALRRLAQLAERFELDADTLAEIDPSDLQAALEALDAWLRDEAELLAACDCDGEGLRGLCAALDGRPGRGGITRGRGDARLEFKGETPEHQGRFLLDRLKPKAAGDKPGEMLSMKTREGEEGPDASAPRGLSRDFSDTEQDIVGQGRVLPRHRGVVKRFFDGRKDPKTPATPSSEKK